MTTADIPPGRGERIELAVQRAMVRRRRLLRLYLFLLVIPVGAAFWFVVAGRTDREVVQQAVETRVAPVEQRYAEIAPKLDQVKGLGEVLPEVQNAAQEVRAQKAQVSALTEGQSQLKQQLTDVTSHLQTLEPQVRALRVPLPDKPLGGELAARIDELARNVKDLQQGQEGIVLQQRRITADLERLRVERPPAPGAGAPDLGRLELRLQQLEQDNQALRGEMRKLRTVRPPG